jgi:hypothetical protein
VAAYDVIVSEPSNPWVSGVASLFTDEFYAKVRRRLAPGGLFVQWLQLYEMEEALLASILKAFARHFPHLVLYLPDRYNTLVVGSADTEIGAPDPRLFDDPLLAAELRRVGIDAPAALLEYRAADQDGIARVLRDYDVPPHSDYFPMLDQHAARARYLRATATGLVDRARAFREAREE